MQTSIKVDELIEVLKNRGLNEEAVKNVRNGLWDQASETFMNNMLGVLTDEDLQKVEAAATQEEANNTLRQLYQEKLGKDMEEEMRQIVDQYATELIEKYKVEEPKADQVISQGTYGQEAPAETPTHEEDTIHDLT